MMGQGLLILFFVLGLLALDSAAAASREISLAKAAYLIRMAEPMDRRKAQHWAREMRRVFRRHRFRFNKTNVCSSIAIIDQESGFVADPPVGISGNRIVRQARRELRARPQFNFFLEKFFSDALREFYARLRRARTEKHIDLAYRKLVQKILNTKGIAFIIKFVPEEIGLAEYIDAHNPVKTIGSMQVSIEFAKNSRPGGKPEYIYQYNRLRDFMYTTYGGMYYGVKRLLGYYAGYPSKIYMFADYNAGRYSSRNAAFQYAVSILSGRKLALDGDLLVRDRFGRIVNFESNTYKATEYVLKKQGIYTNLKKDLPLEKKYIFIHTGTYKAISRIYRRAYGRKMPYAIIPKIHLKSIKIQNRFTTRKFARNVYRRYKMCMSR